MKYPELPKQQYKLLFLARKNQSCPELDNVPNSFYITNQLAHFAFDSKVAAAKRTWNSFNVLNKGCIPFFITVIFTGGFI